MRSCSRRASPSRSMSGLGKPAGLEDMIRTAKKPAATTGKAATTTSRAAATSKAATTSAKAPAGKAPATKATALSAKTKVPTKTAKKPAALLGEVDLCVENLEVKENTEVFEKYKDAATGEFLFKHIAKLIREINDEESLWEGNAFGAAVKAEHAKATGSEERKASVTLEGFLSWYPGFMELQVHAVLKQREAEQLKRVQVSAVPNAVNAMPYEYNALNSRRLSNAPRPAGEGCRLEARL
eukprot:scaffold41232_cov66-Phaeocystis_antarctica.AAC.2